MIPALWRDVLFRIKCFVSDLWQVVDFLITLWFPLPINLTVLIMSKIWNILLKLALITHSLNNNPINRFNAATFLCGCLSKTRTLDFKHHMSWSVLCSVSYIVRGYYCFINIGGIRAAERIFGHKGKRKLGPPSSNSPNNDTQTKSTTVCHKQGISTTKMNWWIVI